MVWFNLMVVMLIFLVLLCVWFYVVRLLWCSRIERVVSCVRLCELVCNLILMWLGVCFVVVLNRMW